MEKILLIEDDKFLSHIMAKKLKMEGFEVTVAIDGEEALRAAREEKPRLVLLDLVLPGMDGFEVLKLFKKDPLLKDIPVFILSNLGQQDDVKKGFELGADGFLVKAQLEISQIVKKIKDILEK